MRYLFSGLAIAGLSLLSNNVDASTGSDEDVISPARSAVKLRKRIVNEESNQENASPNIEQSARSEKTTSPLKKKAVKKAKRSLNGELSISSESAELPVSMDLDGTRSLTQVDDMLELEVPADANRDPLPQDDNQLDAGALALVNHQLYLQGDAADVITAPGLQADIKARLKFADELPMHYKTISVLMQPGIRYLPFDIEFDKQGRMTEFTALEFRNGKLVGKLIRHYKDINALHAMKGKAHLALREILDFLKDDPTKNEVTIVVAHNASADISQLFRELKRHYEAPHTGGYPRILEHETFTINTFCTYRYLLTDYLIAADRKSEQATIKTVEFSYAETMARAQKAKVAKEKRLKSKEKKRKQDEYEEAMRIQNGDLLPDGNFRNAGSGNNNVEATPNKRPSLKLQDAIVRAGSSKEKAMKSLRITDAMAQEKGGNLDYHEALTDTVVMHGLVAAEIDWLKFIYPTERVKSLDFDSLGDE